MNDLEKKSIECLKNMPIEETTYQVARNVVLDYITDLEKRFNSLLEAHKICDEEEQEKQERIDKAIGFIKNTKVVSYEQDEVYLFKDIPEGYDLLNILQGSDKE